MEKMVWGTNVLGKVVRATEELQPRKKRKYYSMFSFEKEREWKSSRLNRMAFPDKRKKNFRWLRAGESWHWLPRSVNTSPAGWTRTVATKLTRVEMLFHSMCLLLTLLLWKLLSLLIRNKRSIFVLDWEISVAWSILIHLGHKASQKKECEIKYARGEIHWLSAKLRALAFLSFFLFF